METKQTISTGSFWWLNSATPGPGAGKQTEREISSSLAEYLEHEQEAEVLDDDIDIPSILEEISRLSAKSPLGQYQKDIGQLTIDEIMREAEKIYMESSKSFEQLSQKSKTPQKLSNLIEHKAVDNSTPAPNMLSQLPLAVNSQASSSTSDTESFEAEEENIQAKPECSPVPLPNSKNGKIDSDPIHFDEDSQKLFVKGHSPIISSKESPKMAEIKKSTSISSLKEKQMGNNSTLHSHENEMGQKDGVIKMLLYDNKGLKEELKSTLNELNETKHLQLTASSTLEALKDAQEQKTALQLQLEAANKTQGELRSTCDELLNANNILERRVLDMDGVLTKYKSDLVAIQNIRDKLKENEFNANKQLEQERALTKQLKQQMEKDAKCILDLNRQIKEMERIIARKHPDSVSALIVASKYDEHGARKVFEERIKSLEQEALMRDAQNSKVFKDVQEKFNQMKLKYESHIEDLELHVNDLKSQLKRKGDTYDVYTQTLYHGEIIPAKDATNCECQTEPLQAPGERNLKTAKKAEVKDDAHLVATIRGYQAEISSKERILIKMQKDMDELRKTNRRLQKEREGSLKTNFGDKKVVDSKMRLAACTPLSPVSAEVDGPMGKDELVRVRAQLVRIEKDYQALKAKRLQDLNTLQEAHEREMSNYLANITPLREKLDMQTISFSALQQQLITTKEELAIVTVERDHLNNKLNSGVTTLLQDCNFENGNDNETVVLRKKFKMLELKYEERENRLRAIVHGLAQKTIMNRTCQQCAERQQQLIGYKVELDQIIATLRCMQ